MAESKNKTNEVEDKLDAMYPAPNEPEPKKKSGETEKADKKDKPAKPQNPGKPKKVSSKSRRENPEDVTEEDLNYIYEKRRTYTIDGRDRAKYYKESDITTYGGDEMARSEKRDEKDEAIILTAAARTYPPEILVGEVVGYSETDNTHIPMVLVELENSTGYNQIRIPVSHFIAYDKNEYADEKGRKILASYISSFFGARVRFVVFEYQEKEHIAYASRLKAMEIISEHFYRKLNKAGDARIRVGEAATATVISTMRDRLTVDVCGADVIIKSKDLSWLALGPVNDEFRIGDSFPVKILGIPKPTKYEINGQSYTLMLGVKASKKELMAKPNEKYYDRYKKGDIVAGVIKSENSASGIFVNIQNHMTVLCDTVPGNPPIGSTCTVLIVNKFDDDKMIRGNVLPNSIRPPKSAF